MPGAVYAVKCTACDLPLDAFERFWPPAQRQHEPWLFGDLPTLTEFYGLSTSSTCVYCPECGYVGEERSSRVIVCEDCGQRESGGFDFFSDLERCRCGGKRTVHTECEHTPQCPRHPQAELVVMSLRELQNVNNGVTGIPCQLCRGGTLAIVGEVALLD